MAISKNTAYSRPFFTEMKDLSGNAAQEIVPLILELTRCQSVIDVGCGEGSWLACLQKAGVQEITGVDGDYVPRDTLQIPLDRFIPADLNHPFHIERRFDLAMCLEVAEHLPAEAGKTLVTSLIQLAPMIAFSAGVPHQGGVHHINEQFPSYWAALFEAQGYVAVDCFRPRIWNNSRVVWWYAQNLLLYVHPERLASEPQLQREYEMTRQSMFDLVHPSLYLTKQQELSEFHDPETMPVRKLLPLLGEALKQTWKRRWMPKRSA